MLFLVDLRSGYEVTFRPRVFSAIFSGGLVLFFVASLLLAPMTDVLGVPALPDGFLPWVVVGLVAALVSFKWERVGP